MSMPLQPLLARTLFTALLGFRAENAGGEFFYFGPVVKMINENETWVQDRTADNDHSIMHQ
jgi:hypothetical protein